MSGKVIEVAAAVILRPDGAFLLAQRPAGKVYAGYWEFPGGKVEPGEPVANALARELHEELGIDVRASFPWITRVFTYPHGTVRLNFRRVLEWSGEPHPREDQAIAWQRLDAPLAEPMLPANAPVLASLALPAEYAITDAGTFGVPRMLKLVEQRMASGLRMVQVREPKLEAAALAGFTRDVIALGKRYACKVLAKARVDGADGLHVTAAELARLPERPTVPLVGASCHSREEVERAAQLGLDFAVLGPVKPTTSHPGASPFGWPAFERRAAGSAIPVYAIGGLNRADLAEAMRHGAHGLAMISGAWSG